MDGRIKIHRKILDWERFTDSHTYHLFSYCLLRANHKDTQWRGIDIKAGSFITSIDSIKKSTGMTTKNIRTAINHLKTTNEVAIKTTNKYTMIIVIKWEEYQIDSDKVANKVADKVANEGQTSGKQVATDKNDKNNKEELNGFVNKRNNIKTISSKKGLPETRKINSALVDIWNKKRKEYSMDEMVEAINNYCNDILNRQKRNETDTFYDHRFSLFEFLTRKGGLDTFINKKG